MSLIIPFQFRVRWQTFFATTLPQFLGYDSYSVATPIIQAIIGFSQLAVAAGFVWLIGWAITKVFKEIFG